ncbi:hypothetical protein PIB30_060410 [Stylosanthes scabra]|uniref:Uncharacterized protein n=1 Tax=Stylosanthes scabra TaxID=79078 RepID=A0ABU6RKH3_9FABA|nr:hypothetical protein [Stylosanthes scabra]
MVAVTQGGPSREIGEPDPPLPHGAAPSSRLRRRRKTHTEQSPPFASTSELPPTQDQISDHFRQAVHHHLHKIFDRFPTRSRLFHQVATTIILRHPSTPQPPSHHHPSLRGSCHPSNLVPTSSSNHPPSSRTKLVAPSKVHRPATGSRTKGTAPADQSLFRNRNTRNHH